MFVMMAWGTIRAGAWDEFQEYYVGQVAPQTGEMTGLQERQLWRGTSDPQESVSWSLWDSLDTLRAYETSGARRDLAQRADQYYQPWAYSTGEFWVKHFEIIAKASRDEDSGST
jgi:heme-degrading monooxygenase HmoA